jgi:Transcriptional regulator C-terminal region
VARQFLQPVCVYHQMAKCVSQYLAGAFLNLLKWWLETEMPYSPAQMDEMFQQLALPGVWAAVEGKRASPQGDVF